MERFINTTATLRSPRVVHEPAHIMHVKEEQLELPLETPAKKGKVKKSEQ